MIRASFLLLATLSILSSFANSGSRFILEENTQEVEATLASLLLSESFQVTSKKIRSYEIYFDSPELYFFLDDGSLRYRAVEYLSKKKKNRKYHEHVQFTSSGGIAFEYPVKHYGRLKSPEEKHNLLGLIKRGDREAFIVRLEKEGIKYPLRIKEVFHIAKITDIYELSRNQQVFASIQLDSVTLLVFDQELDFFIFNIQLDEGVVRSFPDDIQESIFSITSSLGTFLSALAVSADSSDIVTEYTLLFSYMKNHTTLFNWFFQYPYLPRLLYAIGFSLAGLLLMKIFFWTRFVRD
jgi:hypothetical protein